MKTYKRVSMLLVFTLLVTLYCGIAVPETQALTNLSVTDFQITDALGQPLHSASLANYSVKSTVTLVNNTGGQIDDCTLVLALYSGNNAMRLVNLNYISQALPTGSSTLTTPALAIPTDGQMYTLKAFVWDNITGMMPYCNSKTVVMDDFEDGTFSEWSTFMVSGSPAQYSILNGEGSQNKVLYNTLSTGTDTTYALTGDSSWTDYTCEAKIKVGKAAGNCGLAFRYIDPNNFYTLRINLSGTPALDLYKFYNGTPNKVKTSTAIAFNKDAYYRLKVVGSGNVISCYVDDVLISSMTYTDSTNPILSGKAGFRTGGGTNGRVDDFVIIR